jgi:PucR-like helix-turn-helix protein
MRPDRTTIGVRAGAEAAERTQTEEASSTTLAAARGRLARRLALQLPEIEAAVAARVYTIADPRETADLSYIEGLRSSLKDAVSFALAVIEAGEEHAPELPTGLLAQARGAARQGVPLETVLRRYLAGYAILAEFVLQEADRDPGLGGRRLQELLRGQANAFDRLVQRVSREYGLESQRSGSKEDRRLQRLRRLLAGEQPDTSGFTYDFGGHHNAIIGGSTELQALFREVGEELDRAVLAVAVDGDLTWAWLGGRRRLCMRRLREALTRHMKAGDSVAIGECNRGVSGWRLSHRQAAAALPFAIEHSGGPVQYRDVALAASMRQDDLLSTSLQQLFLEPLSEERDKGGVLRETLRAFFNADRNVTSAAAALGVKRHTVTNRLRTIEAALDLPLSRYYQELEAATRLERVPERPDAGS